MDSAQEKAHMYFNFDGGEVEFQGEKAVVKGSLLFDFVHEIRSPNLPAIQDIGVQVKKWLQDHLDGSPEILETCCSLLKLAAHTLAYIQPEAYTRDQEDEISMRKAFWLVVLAVIEWFTDDLDDKEEYRTDPHFKIMNKFFSSTLFKIYSFQFSKKEELKTYIEEFGLYEKYPKFYELFYLWFNFSQEFFADPLMKDLGITREKMSSIGTALEQEYLSNSWMDGVGLEKVESFHLYANKRVQNSGGLVQITMCGIMEGFHEPELGYIFRDQHLERFRFLYVMTISLVNELLSLKKELKAGETNNAVLIWVKKGKSLQESVNKAIKKHNQFLQEARQLYNFLQKEHKNDPKLLGYLGLILKQFSGVCQFQGLFCDRYGDVKWSIDSEKNP